MQLLNKIPKVMIIFMNIINIIYLLINIIHMNILK